MTVDFTPLTSRARGIVSKLTFRLEQSPHSIADALPTMTMLFKQLAAQALPLFAFVCLAWAPFCLRADEASLNLAPFATAKTSFVSGHESLEAIHNGFDPASSDDHSHDAYGNWPNTGVQWVEYDWDQPISTR